jgi:hypothetical protein
MRATTCYGRSSACIRGEACSDVLPRAWVRQLPCISGAWLWREANNNQTNSA